MKLILIAALNNKRVIGKDGKIPWHIPEDLQRFKKLTLNHTVLMGRKTYESVRKPLPNRRNVVITSRNIPGIETYPSLESAFDTLKNEESIFIIGGGSLFQRTIAIADELFLTQVENEEDGDILFPEFETGIKGGFSLRARERNEGYSFLTYVRM